MEQIAHGLCTTERISWSKVRPVVIKDFTTFDLGLKFCFSRMAHTKETHHGQESKEIRRFVCDVEQNGRVIFQHAECTEFFLFRQQDGICSLFSRFTSHILENMDSAQHATEIESFHFLQNARVEQRRVSCECKSKNVTELGCQLCVNPFKLRRRTGLTL